MLPSSMLVNIVHIQLKSKLHLYTKQDNNKILTNKTDVFVQLFLF